MAGASGGTAETLDAAHTGLVVPCESAEGLAGVVVRLLDDPETRAGMGARGREWVARFDWDALGEQARGLFQPNKRRAPEDAKASRLLFAGAGAGPRPGGR